MAEYSARFNYVMSIVGWWFLVPALVTLSIIGNLSPGLRKRWGDTLSFVLAAVRRYWVEIYFAAGLGVAIFAYGVVVGSFKIFPYAVLGSAGAAWIELKSSMEPARRRPHEILTNYRAGGVVIHDPELAYDGLTFISLYRDGQFELALFDMNGEMLHRWRVSPNDTLKQKNKNIRRMRAAYKHTIHGAVLYRNGDVLFNFEYKGLVKLDRCSNVIWTLDEPTNHALAVEDDGTIWVPSRRLVTHAADAYPRMRVPYHDEQILKLSPGGEILSRISVMDVLFDAKYEGLFFGGRPDWPASLFKDPLHLNDVEIVNAALARKHPALARGDLMLSLRNPNALVFVDPRTGALKWVIRGPFLRQHDPDILPDGTLMVFDNRMDAGSVFRGRRITEPQVFGYSRIVHMDPATMRTLWVYEGSTARPFYSSIQGKVQSLPNGNILVVEPEAGRAFEIETETKSVVWEFINLLDSATGTVGRLTQADRIPRGDAAFVDEPCT